MLDSAHTARIVRAMGQCTMKTAAIEVVHGAVVAPLTRFSADEKGNLTIFDGGVYYSDGTVCKRGLHIKNGLKNVPGVITNGKEVLRYKGLHLFAGMLKNEHFGHFLAESLARLWATKILSQDLESIVFYLRIASLQIPNYIHQTLALLCPGTKITIVSSLSSFETLAIPDQIAHPEIGFIYGHPAVKTLFAGMKLIRGDGHKRIYVSRSLLSSNEGQIINEEIIERNLEKEGYRVIHPQKLSVEQQISIYNDAHILVFAEGSALHLYALLARVDQKVFIIRRRQIGIVFDWQILSFGGPIIVGGLCVTSFLIPKKDGLSMLRAKAILDFDHLRDLLKESDFISGEKWESQSEKDLKDAISKANVLSQEVLVSHPP